ncbi:hypothetical protein AB0B50_32460 [Streptomyces sp. NPDC041068]|uniref:hypothetical protein n=1 Tax=Streptomyces sp. NPDC041068 TaxID=3155130 RepID=UPI0033F5C5BC
MTAAVLMGVALTGATAVPAVAAPAKSDGVQVKRDGCRESWGFKFKAKESVKIRTKPKRSAASIGLFPKGASACFIANEDGGKYTACGKTDTYWTEMRYRGMHGYVMMTCTIGTD